MNTEIVQQITDSQKLAKLIKDTKCILLKFSAKWCGPCQNENFKKNYDLLKDNFKQFISDIKFIELDIDDYSDIINDTRYYDLNVASIPHFKLCYDGDIIKEYNGCESIMEIDKNIKTILQKIMQDNN